MAGVRLIDLQTDLKSLRYGGDKPYVTKDINNPPSSNQTGMQITKRVDDVSRIAQMLVDRPGLKFIGNQALLQQTDTVEKLQKANQRGKEALQIAKNTAKNTAKIVGSTLAQVPVNGTGTHFVYAFRTDTYLQPLSQGDTSAFREFFGEGGVEGAPLALRGEKIQGRVESNFVNNETDFTNPADTLDLLQPEDSKYTADSTYGSNSSNYINGTSKFTPSGSNFYIEEEGADILNIPLNQVDLTTRENTNSEIITPQEYSRDKYNSQNKFYELEKKRLIAGSEKNVVKEKRINLGNQGKKVNVVNYTDTDPDTVDKLNELDIQDTRPDGINEARDLAKFFFEIITPEGSKFLNFRAFIDSLDDSYNADWQGFRYTGRAEEFYTYGGFSRDISVSFKVAAATRKELKPLYKKMVYLASTTAPTYSGQGFMRGSLVRLSLGSYFSQLPGVLTSVKYSWDKEYPWEIALGSPEGAEGDVQELPMVLNCSISFKAIHDFAPQTGLKHYITNPEPGVSFF